MSDVQNGDDPVRRRWLLIMIAFYKFNAAYKKRHPLARALHIDPALVYQIATSYQIDIERFKAFHLTPVPTDPNDPRNFADDVKQFAFLMHWLMKLRPVFALGDIKDAGAMRDDGTLLSNAVFAFGFCSNFQARAMKGKLLAEFLYSMTYREITRDGYLMIASMTKTFSESGLDEGSTKRKDPSPMA
jgi:hypothetical protein